MASAGQAFGHLLDDQNSYQAAEPSSRPNRSSALFSSLQPITVLECPLGNGLDLLVIADKSRPATTNRLILCIFRTFFRRFAEQEY